MRSVGLILLCCLSLYSEDKTVPAGLVTPEVLNIRSGPGLGHRVIGTLRRDEIVKLDGLPGSDWCRIRMPDHASVWIAASMVDSHLIPLKGAQFRCGPGVAYEELGSAGSQKLEIREFAKDGKWLRVKPVDGLFAYVNTSFLKIDKPAADSEKKAGSESKSVPLGNSRSVSLIKHSGVRLVAEGIVIPLEQPSTGSTHVLVVNVNGEMFPTAYLYADSLNLKLWEKRQVRVSGMQYWVNSLRRPLISVEKIVPAWQK